MQFKAIDFLNMLFTFYEICNQLQPKFEFIKSLSAKGETPIN